jgi:hypothetical protein
MSENRKQNEDLEQNKDRVSSTSRQEQGDPPITEIRGFFNPDEDLEPTLTDGTKAPDKAKEENRVNERKSGK